MPERSSRHDHRATYIILGATLLAATVLSAAIGAFTFSPAAMFRYLTSAPDAFRDPADALARNVFLQLRLPRVALSALTGAVLAVSGTLMQGLFRNPIVEPGLAGTSAGAALGASLVFVFAGSPALTAMSPLGLLAVPTMAFAGGLVATMLAYRAASSLHKVDVFALLLAGVAVNAVCNAGTAFLSYIARDPQARNITFWSLGTFTTADWRGVALVAVGFAVGFPLALRHAKALNSLALGEETAASLGVDSSRLVPRLIIVNTIMVALATAIVGVIAFVGLVVPHALRLRHTSDHRFLIPASALAGAISMELVDVVSRVLIRPAELPVGIVTAVVGAPLFLRMLVTQQRRGRLA